MSLKVFSPPANSRIGYYAGFVSRLVAFIIDTVIISGTLLFTAWFVRTTLRPEQFGGILRVVVRQIPSLGRVVDFLFSPGMIAVLSFTFIVAYYIFFWYNAGQTPGKAILGIKIVPLSGVKLTLAQAFLRFFTYYVSGLALGLGFLWIIVDDRRMAWHDRFSGTCVIYVWDARPDEAFLAPALLAITKQRSARQHETWSRFADQQEKPSQEQASAFRLEDPSLQELPEVERSNID
jgi:uncharacterized RDD family membrane protein YckC